MNPGIQGRLRHHPQPRAPDDGSEILTPTDVWHLGHGFRWQPLPEGVPHAHPNAKRVECPDCKYVGRDDDGSGMLSDTRSAVGIRFGIECGIVSCGYRCPACGHVFGHAADVPEPTPPTGGV